MDGITRLPNTAARFPETFSLQSSKQKYKTTKSQNYLDVAECLDVKRSLRMQTPAFGFRTITK